MSRKKQCDHFLELRSNALPITLARRKREERIEWLVLGAGLILITLLFLYPVWSDRQLAVAREADRLSAQALVIDQSLVRSLTGISRALEGVREELPFYRSRTDGFSLASRRLKALTDAMPGINSMFILDAQGNGMAIGTTDSIRVPHSHGNFAKKRYFQEPSQHPDPDMLYVSAPFRSDVGIWAFALTKIILTPSGDFDGMVVATVDLDDYKLLLGSARYVQDQFSIVVHGNGQQIISEPSERLESGRDLNLPGTFFSRHVATGQVNSLMQGRTLTTRGDFLIAAHTVKPPMLHMNYALIVGVGREIEAMLEPWYSMLKVRMTMIGLFWLFSSFGLLAWQRTRRKTAAVAAAQTRTIEHFFDSPLSMLAVLDVDGRCVRLSSAWHETLGWDLLALRGQTVHQFLHTEDQAAMAQARHTLLALGKVDRYFCRMRDTTGSYHELQIQAVLHDGLQYIDARDVTLDRTNQRALRDLNEELMKKEEELTKLAQRDGLTNLANRRYFDEFLLREWQRCQREKEPVSLIMIDIDHFKAYNDHYGHPVGDTCLRAVANELQRVVRRPNDLLARYGGEEFVVLLGNTEEYGASLVANELMRAVRELALPHAASNTAESMTISVGFVSMIPTEVHECGTLMQRADLALYRAKTEGRNRVVDWAGKSRST